MSMDEQSVISAEEYTAFHDFLQNASGIVLGAGKEYLVASRLYGVMRHYAIPDMSALLSQLRTNRNPHLLTAIIDAMTTNETFWFRDPAHFSLFSELLLPELTEWPGRRLRIWSAACSSGQEPYSISMSLQEYQQRNAGRNFGIQEIVATDISPSMLEVARRGVYCGFNAGRGLSDQQRTRYFNVRDECIAVRPEIKKRIAFRELNLTKGYELLGRFDVIFCRNVLIYFSHRQKQDIIARMARVLNPGGYLFLGSSESLSNYSDRFQMITSHGGIVYRLQSD